MNNQFQVKFSFKFQQAICGLAPMRIWKWGMLAMFIACAATALAGDAANSAADQERLQVQLLQSDAPPDQKALACKKLAVYGTEKAVPALTPLLSDERLSSWALIAFEAIPGPAPEKALRKAAGKLHGKLLVAVIDTIGVRRDKDSAKVLIGKLNDSDKEVAAAAAVSLGEIGGPQAAKALKRALGKASVPDRASVAEGCIRCAEHFLADAKASEAIKLYDAVWHSPLPQPRTLEGMRGAILARGPEGIPILLAQLQSDDRQCFNLGLRVARELPGKEATEAVIGAFRQTTPERQPLLLLALADRQDAPKTVVANAAGPGEKRLRLVAIGILDRWGDPSTLPLLLAGASDEDSEIAEASLAALARLPGNDVDTQLLARLPDSSGKMRAAIITLAARRGIEKALPLIVQSVADANAEVRSAAIQALTTLGGVNEIAGLAQALQKSEIPAERAHIENVLVTLSGRIGANSVASLLVLFRNPELANQKAALHALVAAGGSEALAAIATATDDKDPLLQEEAIRTLCTWPNAWPEDADVSEALLHTAKTDTNSAHEILALRGYLQFLLGDEKLKEDDKLAKMQEVMPLLRRPEEKITAIAVLQGIPSAAALELLAALASEPAIADDACAALVQTAAQSKSLISSGQRKNALQLAIQKCTKEDTRHKAEEVLKSLQ